MIYILIVLGCTSLGTCCYCSYHTYLVVRAAKRALPSMRNTELWPLERQRMQAENRRNAGRRRNNSDDEALYEGIAADELAHGGGGRLLEARRESSGEEEDDEYYDEEEESEESEYDDEYASESGSEESEITPATAPVRSSQVALDDEIEPVNQTLTSE